MFWPCSIYWDSSRSLSSASRLAVVGSVAVLIMGLLGREVAGPAVGIGAALISALDPLWLGPIGALMSESIYLVIIPLALLLALRCVAEPTFWRFGALGLVIGLGVLTRSEAIDFVVLVGVPLILMVRSSWKNRCVLGLALLVGAALMLGPWLVRNEVKTGRRRPFDPTGRHSGRVILHVDVRPDEPPLRRIFR